jgi:hypothetical protein
MVLMILRPAGLFGERELFSPSAPPKRGRAREAT